MLLEQYAERILSECYVDYYLSSSYDGGRTEWPFRMFPPSEVYPRYVEVSEQYIVDSAFNDPNTTNKDVLDTAHEVGADMVVLEDVYQDYVGTVDRVLSGLETVEDHSFSGQAICPLQEPIIDCYEELGEPDYVAIGGLKDADESTKIAAAQELRRFAGPDTYIHGLGWGASEKLIDAIRSDPNLLDSIDAQTEGVEASKQDIWPGSEQSTPIAVYTLARLLDKCRRMSPLPTEPATNRGNENLKQWVEN